MVHRIVKKGIFIVGTPRSGTTLLQSIFAANPSIHTFPESHFFTGTAKRPVPYFGAFVYRNPENFARKFLTTIAKDSYPYRLSQFGLVSRLRAFLHPTLLVDYFLDLLDQMAVAHGKPIWLEKTPKHLHYLDWIERSRSGNDLFFVHILRDHDPTVRSLQKASATWVRPLDFAAASQDWEADLRLHARYMSLPNHAFVSYERLVADPSTTAAALFERIGLEFSESFVDASRRMAEKIVRPEEIWKKRNFSEIGFSEHGSGPMLPVLPRAPSQASLALYQRLVSAAV